MTIPIGSNYPTEIDTNQNLFQVHDALRVRLAEDYNLGDTSITIVGDETVMRQFYPTGIITLTEQCSEPELRAISFYYSARTLTTFTGLELLSGFTDVIKPKDITNVTQNVMSLHHNNLKDALIAIEHMAGKKGEAPLRPLEGTMEQRITYLRDLVLSPKAWFKANHTLGLAPFTVTFTDQSFRLGTDGTSQEVTHIWDFGDNTGPSIITIEEDTEVTPPELIDILVSDTDGKNIIKTYTTPGIYDVTLTITNDFGTDSVIFPDLITARYEAPDLATIGFQAGSAQAVTLGDPPTIRSVINSLITVTATDSGEHDVDPIIKYTWHFSDDLIHNNSSTTRASFSVGGIYDLILRTDTEFGAYRITNYDNSFDIIENINLWLWTYGSGNIVHSTEFGLLSETFKTKSTNDLTISQNDSFLDGVVNEDQQKREFLRNNGFCPSGTASSGAGGVGLLYWASGRDPLDPISDEEIKIAKYNGFSDVYSNPSLSQIFRPWNWIGFPSDDKIYFILGRNEQEDIDIPLDTSPTHQRMDQYDLSSETLATSTFANSNYKNGADELKNNEVSYDAAGLPEQGHMSVYRSAWWQNTGYFLRNEGVGTFFRIKSFYKTSGNTSNPVVNINKLPVMAGSARVEGQLVSLSQGVYFFSNSGSVAAYSPSGGVWGTGGPGINASSFRLLQDTTVLGFDEADQTLLATSDGDKIAYLSFDYSVNAFIKFNEVDTTFSGVTARPSGTQWQMCIF